MQVLFNFTNTIFYRGIYVEYLSVAFTTLSEGIRGGGGSTIHSILEVTCVSVISVNVIASF